jgi:hypothetical protein
MTLPNNTHCTIIGNITEFYSYRTLVAMYDHTASRLYVTTKKWSRTTTKHIKAFMADVEGIVVNVEQEALEAMAEERRRSFYTGGQEA